MDRLRQAWEALRDLETNTTALRAARAVQENRRITVEDLAHWTGTVGASADRHAANRLALEGLRDRIIEARYRNARQEESDALLQDLGWDQTDCA
jgi:predicted transcriptional regulator of viral defense system